MVCLGAPPGGSVDAGDTCRDVLGEDVDEGIWVAGPREPENLFAGASPSEDAYEFMTIGGQRRPHRTLTDAALLGVVDQGEGGEPEYPNPVLEAECVSG